MVVKILMLMVAISSGFVYQGLLKASEPIKNVQVAEFTFEGEFENKLSNTQYQTIGGNPNFGKSKEDYGESYEPKGSKFEIPFSDVGITAEDSEITVSFLMKWDGDFLGSANDGYMPFGIFPAGGGANIDLWVSRGNIGFNSGRGEQSGIQMPGVAGEWHEFTLNLKQGEIEDSRMWLDGVEQSLTLFRHNPELYPKQVTWGDDASFLVGGYSDNYLTKPDSAFAIDELKIFKGELTPSEVATYSSIPDLRMESGETPKLSWATELLPEDVLYQTGFEVGDDINSTSNTNASSLTTEEKYSGERSLYVKNSIVYGNNGHADGSVSYRYDLNRIDGLQPGMKFTANVKMKAIEDKGLPVTVSSRGTGSFRASYPFHEKYGLGVPIVVAQDTSSTPGEIRIQNYEQLKSVLNPDFMYYVAQTQTDNYGTWVTFKTTDLNDANQSIRVAGTNYKAGQVLHHLDLAYPLGLGSQTVVNDGEWRTYNFNGELKGVDYYDAETRGIVGYINLKNSGELWIDDIKLGHATKVRLYRNGKVLYEGYDSLLNDESAIDVQQPKAPSDIAIKESQVGQNRVVHVSFPDILDSGTEYKYEMSAISKSGVETPVSQPVTFIASSGIAGYSYELNHEAEFEPDDIVDSVSADFSIIQELGALDEERTLHIKTIDNNGNQSETVHLKLNTPKLSVQANPTENMIRLDWEMEDVNYQTFRIYQKRPDSNDFEVISATNFDDANPVRVLNLFPTYDIPEKTTGEVDIAGETLHKSAMLAEWIADYGMGKINVDSLNYESFQEDIDKWLKSDNGEYLYDVIVVGFWNVGTSAVHPSQQHLNDEAVQAIAEFIESGRGVLTGHHMMGLWNLDKGMNQLKELFGVKFVTESNWDKVDSLTPEQIAQIDYIIPDSSAANNFSSRYWHNNSKLEAVRTGSLLTYPHYIAEEGRVFNVEYSHNTNDFITGDVWLEFVPGNGYGSSSNVPVRNITELPDGTTGTKNSYLSTYKNTGLIQTGHATLGTGVLKATEDEKKILANTLFYLNQLSSATYLNDFSGADVAAPEMPSVEAVELLGKSNLSVQLSNVNDSGSKYSYYVEATSSDGAIVMLSNVMDVEIEVGLAGYSFVVDEYEDTIPDGEVDVDGTTSDFRVVTTGNKPQYLHIKSLDKAGNASETVHIQINTGVGPVIQGVQTPETWTSGTVELSVQAESSDSYVESIVVPSGSHVQGAQASYTVSSNGSYEFRAIDALGNESSYLFHVSNIDSHAPSILIQTDPDSEWSNQDISVQIHAIDN